MYCEAWAGGAAWSLADALLGSRLPSLGMMERVGCGHAQPVGACPEKHGRSAAQPSAPAFGTRIARVAGVGAVRGVALRREQGERSADLGELWLPMHIPAKPITDSGESDHPIEVPVRSAMWMTITTSQQRGQTREGMSEGLPAESKRRASQGCFPSATCG